LPLLLQKPLGEHDMRLRTQAAALSSFYLDALRGLIPVRAHDAGPMMRREQESLLVSWMGTGRALARVATAIDALQASIGFALAIWMLERHMGHGREVGATLLALYWVLSIPALGQEIALLARQYPTLRNVTLRLLEPLGAREDVEASFSRASISRLCLARMSRWSVRLAPASRAWSAFCSVGTGLRAAGLWSTGNRSTERVWRVSDKRRPGSTRPCSCGIGRCSATWLNSHKGTKSLTGFFATFYS
jgi:hypothetical protein